MFVFNDNKILVRENNIDLDLDFKNFDGGTIINTSKDLPANWQNLPAWLDVKDPVLKDDDEYINLRAVWHKFGYEIFLKVGGAWQFANWFRNAQFCSHCGEILKPRDRDYGRYCPKCERVFYAPLSPAVIVAIEKNNKLLLAHNSAMPANRFSLIAGFVEPGETLEQAVEREVKEEVSLKIADIKYFASQPWPFPNSLMFGFNAKWADNNINVDGEEILDANWYSCDEIKNMLDNIPDGASIARRLINNFIANHV